MIHIRREGGLIKKGFNFYPWSDNNFGFVFAWGNDPLLNPFQIRYSKCVKKWYFGKFYTQPHLNTKISGLNDE